MKNGEEGKRSTPRSGASKTGRKTLTDREIRGRGGFTGGIVVTVKLRKAKRRNSE